MVAIPRSSATERIEKILHITAQHFEILALPFPDVQLALPHGEFRDPLPFRWVATPRPACCTSQNTKPSRARYSCAGR